MQSRQDETQAQVFLTHLVGVFQKKTTQNTLAMLYRKEKHKLSDVLSEFVSFLKLGIQW